MVSKKKAQQVLDYLEEHGLTETQKHFGLTNESIKRYSRKAREGLPKQHEDKFPKIFIADIETSLMLLEAFSLWDKYIPHESIHRDWHLLTWAGMYLHDDKMYGDRLTSREAKHGDDSRIMQSLWYHLHNSDIIIAHNGERFDLKKIQVRMMINNIPPYSPVRSIDTLKHVKKIAGHTSNRLDYLARFYGVGSKIHTERELWHNCTFGNKEEREAALEEMYIYNQEDVRILADTYIKIRPYMKSHPNMNVYYNSNTPRCHYCGSENIEPTGDYYTTNISRFPLAKCNDCGGYSPSRFTELSREKLRDMPKSLPM